MIYRELGPSVMHYADRDSNHAVPDVSLANFPCLKSARDTKLCETFQEMFHLCHFISVFLYNLYLDQIYLSLPTMGI